MTSPGFGLDRGAELRVGRAPDPGHVRSGGHSQRAGSGGNRFEVGDAPDAGNREIAVAVRAGRAGVAGPLRAHWKHFTAEERSCELGALLEQPQADRSALAHHRERAERGSPAAELGCGRFVETVGERAIHLVRQRGRVEPVSQRDESGHPELRNRMLLEHG